MVTQQACSITRRRPGQVARGVFQQEGHPLEWAVGQGGGQGGAAVIVQLLRQGIDRRILLFGRSDGGFQQLLRAHLANGHQPGECGGVQLSVGVKIHFSSGGRYLK